MTCQIRATCYNSGQIKLAKDFKYWVRTTWVRPRKEDAQWTCIEEKARQFPHVRYDEPWSDVITFHQPPSTAGKYKADVRDVQSWKIRDSKVRVETERIRRNRGIKKEPSSDQSSSRSYKIKSGSPGSSVALMAWTSLKEEHTHISIESSSVPTSH